MRKLLVLTLFLATPLFAQSELDRAAAAMTGMEASFSHSFTPKGFKTSQTESGTVIFGHLPQMRWTYARPEAKVFVFDGATSWFYVPADKQVTVGHVDDSKRRELPFLLLGDSGARDRAFIVKQKNGSGTVITTLQPRDKAALIRTVTIVSNASTHTIQRIEYADREGNRTAFDFSGYHPRAASADTFRFSPPAGVQTINAE